MGQYLRTSLIFLLLVLPAAAPRADILVLVHGWASSPETWLYSGVMTGLSRNGWVDAGVVAAGPGGILLLPAPGQPGSRRVYRAQLPAEAPLAVQAAHLFAELAWIRDRHGDEPLHLAGHSAGGVAARLVVVRPGAPDVSTLITIASPNLGTERALQGLDIVHDRPFFCPGPGVDFLKSLVGGGEYRYLRDSRGALVDLVPAAPGSLIDWLNHQPHPDIAYHAVVRRGPVADGDELVPAASQDLNRVPALQGRASIHVTPAAHALNPADGELLAHILEGM